MFFSLVAKKSPPKAAAGKLSLSHVSKRFGNSDIAAVEDISLDCQPGEFVVVVADVERVPCSTSPRE